MRVVITSKAVFDFVRAHHKKANDPRLNLSCQAFFSEIMNTLFMVEGEVTVHEKLGDFQTLRDMEFEIARREGARLDAEQQKAAATVP